jgi:hypothetical protein
LFKATCGDFACVLFSFCTRGCGCAVSTRLSLRPRFLGRQVRYIAINRGSMVRESLKKEWCRLSCQGYRLSCASVLILPREGVGRVHRRPLVAVLKQLDADALHRLCAKRRSGGGADVSGRSDIESALLKTPTPARSRSPTSRASLLASDPTRGRQNKVLCVFMRGCPAYPAQSS